MILTIAEKSLDRVLTFYERQSASLSYRPSVSYGDKQLVTDGSIAAKVNVEQDAKEKFAHLFLQQFSGVIWRELYGLNISSGTLEELIAIIQRKVTEMDREGDVPHHNDADIMLFPEYTHVADKDCVMAHEVWHLIEKEHGVFASHVFITEGTATYAMERFRRRACNKSIDECADYFQQMYAGAANIVQQHVSHCKNPYRALLDSRVRTSIQNELLRKIKPIIAAGIRKQFEDGEFRKAAASSLQSIPEFQQLKNNITPKGVIAAYHQMGAVKLARELEGKNLEKLIDLFKKAGF